MREIALEFRSVSKKLGAVQALDNLSFVVPAGTVTAFVGNNGAGKTTTFSMVARYLNLRRGEILLFGQALQTFYKRGGVIGVLPQDAEFFDDVKIFKQLQLFSRLIGMNRSDSKREAERVLEIVRLTDKVKSYPGELSRGMKVRLGIAQALIGSPKLLLLDEPTAGLDPAMQQQFRELIESIRTEATIVVSSHDISELEIFCDYVCYIDSGSLVRQEPLGVLQDEISRVVYRLDGEIKDVASLANLLSDCVLDREGDNSIILDFDRNQHKLAELNQKVIEWCGAKGLKLISITPESSIGKLFRA